MTKFYFTYRILIRIIYACYVFIEIQCLCYVTFVNKQVFSQYAVSELHTIIVIRRNMTVTRSLPR